MNNTEVTIIAEVGSIHDGSFGNAIKAVEIAADCGADIVKFQTHIAESETLRDAPMPPYFDGEPRFDYFKRTAFSPSQWAQLAVCCEKQEVGFLSSPFSLEAVDMLEEVCVSAYKIPSGELTNLPLLEKIAETGKQVFLSTGMCNWAEIDTAVEALSSGGPLVIMQCSSIYPCPPEQVGLNVMLQMKDRYDLPIGYSDHTAGSAACVSAVALGAVVVEKHFTFSRFMYGSDARLSMEPAEFRRLCEEVRDAALIRSNPVNKNDLAKYSEMKRVFEKNIVMAVDASSGTALSAKHFAYKKSGDGISSARYSELIGRRLLRDVKVDDILTWEDLA